MFNALSRTRARRARRVLVLAAALTAALSSHLASGQQAAPRRQPRQVPQVLNFANALFRERKFEMAAEEYERFLKDAQPGPFADEARFGLASARLFLGQYDKARHWFEEFLHNAPEHPNAPAAWYRIGETAYVLGDLPAARKALETYTSNHPKHRYNDTAWPYLGDVDFRLGDLPKAQEAYEKALADFPEGRLADRARLGLGRTLAARGEFEPALKILTALAERGGADWADKAWFQIGQVQEAAGHPAEAVEAFKTLEEKAPRSPLVAEARLQRAEALVKLDKLDEAEALLRDLAAGGAQNLAAQAAFVLGTAQLKRGQAAEAFTTLDGAYGRFANAPIAPALLFRSAEAKLKQGDAAEARARFIKVADASPNDPWADDALLQAARIALDARDFDGAKGLAASFAERFPRSPLRADVRLIEARAAIATNGAKEAIAIINASLEQDKPEAQTALSLRYQLGLAYSADGQADKAKEILDALSNTDAPAAPVASNARFLLGQGHVEAKRFAEAIGPLEKYVADNPDGDVVDYALAHLARAKLEVGQVDDAWKALGQLAERFPKSKVLPPTRLRLAESALAAKQYDRAAEQFRLVIESPDAALKSKAQSGLGWSLLEGGKPAEAAEAFSALLQAAPNDPLAAEAALTRGRALELAKQTEPALAAYAEAAEKYPKSEQASAATLARARLLLDAKKPADAARIFEQYIKDHPDLAKKTGDDGLDALLAEWGWALIDADQAADADRVFTRLLNEFPDSPHAADARFNIAESAHKAGNTDEVLKLLTPLVAEGAKTPATLLEPALYRLGRTQAERKDWAAAAGTLDRLLKDFPESRYRRAARFLRAEVALRSDDPKSADEGFSALLAEPAAPDDPEGFTLALRRQKIQSLLGLKRWQEVIDAADAFKKDAPKDPWLVEVDYARGRALQSVGKFDDARAAYQTVIDTRKGGELAARAQFMRGETFFHQKDYHNAIREFRQVDLLFDAPPMQAAALLQAGKVYEQLAKWPDAAEMYKGLCETLRSKLPPNDPTVKEAESRLEAIRKRMGDAPATAKK